ncbi:RagB/SusD family nutrient uptake outer membrane protein [Portibacter marinus]|uniref:RagB/SusD family nutrient uptake outer membrane protein n=1 Tax=Portibacter marinus TaxID=2898660 RepID=UPI001F1AE123|nr:RagB/SusD family nutrient uptake outer membrane protein [Portibacter marinus]
MNNLKYIFYFTLALLVMSACEKRLELEPAQSISGELATESEANIQNILIGTYSEAGEDDTYGGQLQMMADLLGGGAYIDWVGTFLDPRQVINKAMLSDNNFVGNFWNNSYAAINQANLVLDNLGVVTSDVSEKDRIEGEARFLRALLYFDLIRHFGSGDLGVPLRTTGISDYSIDLGIERAMTSAIYDLIIDDLESAVDLLPEENSFFADKYSAEALLARVHLQLGNFSAAGMAANNVIENSGHVLTPTFAGAFNNDENSTEDVFAFQVTSQDGANDLNNHYADEGNGGRGGDIIVTDAYAALFDEGDERGSFFYASGQSGDRLTSKYIYQFGNIPLIRLAEMYLIRAEASLETGNDVGALPIEDINTIRRRSGAAEVSGEVTKEMILMERVKELGYEGFFIHDVVRTGGSVDGFNADAPELTMPIPQSEMDTNNKIQQNPGY